MPRVCTPGIRLPPPKSSKASGLNSIASVSTLKQLSLLNVAYVPCDIPKKHPNVEIWRHRSHLLQALQHISRSKSRTAAVSVAHGHSFCEAFKAHQPPSFLGVRAKRAKFRLKRFDQDYTQFRSFEPIAVYSHFDPDYSTFPWNLAKSCRVSRRISASGDILRSLKACIALMATRTPHFVFSCTSREWNCIEWCAKLPTKQRNAISVINQSALITTPYIHLN